MFKYTLGDANRLIKSKPCNYYDYTDATIAEWRKHLENSETANYTFLANNIAIANYGHAVAIRKYIDGCVYSWSFHALAGKLDKNSNFVEIKL